MAKKKRSSIYYDDKQTSIADSLFEEPAEEAEILDVKEDKSSEELVILENPLKKEETIEEKGELLDKITISIKENLNPLKTKTLIEDQEILNEEETKEEIDLTKYEIVDIVSVDLCYDKKALVDVNVRNSPEKANNIDRILRKGETITLMAEYDNPIWAKTKDGKYIMKEFLG